MQNLDLFLLDPLLSGTRIGIAGTCDDHFVTDRRRYIDLASMQQMIDKQLVIDAELAHSDKWTSIQDQFSHSNIFLANVNNRPRFLPAILRSP